MLQRNINIIPLLILTVLEGYTISAFAIGIDGGYLILNLHHILGLLAVISNWVIFIFERQLYRYFLPVTLSLGILRLLNFTPYESSFNIGDVPIFQPTSLGIALLTILLNFRKLKDKDQTSTIVISPKIKEEQIENFKTKFQKTTSEDLRLILIEEKYSPFAKEAAEQILKEREIIDQ